MDFALPYPPSANRMWRHVGARVLRSREYESWRTASAALIRAALHGRGLSGPYTMTLRVGRPDRRRRDLDNLIKPCGDVLVLAGAVADDCDCQRVEAHWCADTVGVLVRVSPSPSPSATGVPA